MSRLAVQWRPPSLAVSDGSLFPVRHVWCVGRNYAEHAREMGVEPGEPVFFAKPAQAVVQLDGIAFPPGTKSLHHEVELVALLGGGGRDLSLEQARQAVFGYAVGVDLTRRDVQARAKQAGQPWEMSKGFDESAPIGLIVPADDWQPQPDLAIRLAVDGQIRQAAELGTMLRSLPELLCALSQHVTLGAGDVVFSGTPAGVGPLLPGSRVEARIESLPGLSFDIVQPGSERTR